MYPCIVLSLILLSNPNVNALVLISLEDEFAAYLNETKNETPSNDSLVMNNNKIDDESSFEDISQTLLNDED